MRNTSKEFKILMDDLVYLLDSWGRGCDHELYEMDVVWLKTELSLWYLNIKESEKNDTKQTG